MIPALLTLVIALLLLPSGAALATVSTNVPLESRVYRDIEYLEARGYVKSAMTSTRPYTWNEAKRLYLEALARWGSLGAGAKGRDRRAGAVIKMLGVTLERRTEGGYGAPARAGGLLSLRLSRLYTRFAYSDSESAFAWRNNNGDSPASGASMRAGLDADIGLLGAVKVNLNPEYRSGKDGAAGGDGSGPKLVRGYAIADAGNLQVEAGRDSMWWGAGHSGNLLMTNNAEPLDMIKLTAETPFTLPWVFSRAGLVKPTVFLARLGEQRVYPRANLLGMRLDFKPSPHFQFALNRTFMFGGEGKRSPTLSEWFEVFSASDSAEHSSSPINGNQLASIDASFVYSFDSRWAPLSGVKLYTEWGAEDSGGRTRTPTGRANMYGVFITGPLWINGADLRIEWANTARNERYGPLWYEHSVYSTGYRHEGRVIGHHAGGDARDLFARLQYHAPGALSLGLEYEHLKRAVHSASPAIRQWYEADFEWFLGDVLTAAGFVGHERVEGAAASYSAGLSLSWDW